MRYWTLMASAIAGLLISGSSVRAATVNILCSQDTTIFSFSQIIGGVETGYIDNSGGAAMGIFVGVNAMGSSTSSNVRRALIEFNLSAIPAGAVVQSASLVMGMDRTSDNKARALSLYRLTSSWGEGDSGAGGTVGVSGGGGSGSPAQQNDATWQYRYWNASLGVANQAKNPLTWNTPGGDFVSTPSATTQIGIGQNGVDQYSWTDGTTPDPLHSLLADVDYWLANPSQNFGWIIRGDEVDSSTARRFQSSENDTLGVGEPTMNSLGVQTGYSYADFRPYLDITYTMVPEPTCMGLLLVGAVGLLRRNRRPRGVAGSL